jgi:hypothetical protein
MPYKDKETRRKYQREYQRQLRVGGQYSCLNGALTENKTHKTLFPSHYRIKQAQDLLNVVEHAINVVCEDKLSTPLQKARALGYLVGVGIRVVESANLEGRVEALESVFAVRKKSALAKRGDPA